MAAQGRGEVRADVLIVTAIQLEYDAVLKVETGAAADSTWTRYQDRNNLPYAVRNFRTKGEGGRPLRVAVTCAADMGDVAVTNVALPLIEDLEPRCLAMCGVCAGKPGKTELGDVVAADKLFFNDSGKRIGTKGRDGETVTKIKQDIATYLLRPDWRRALEAIDPKVDYADATWLSERPVPLAWQELRVLEWATMYPGELPSEEWIAQNCPQWEQVIGGLWQEPGITNPTRPQRLESGSITITEAGRAALNRALFQNRGRLPDLSPFARAQPFKLHVGSFASGDQLVEDDSVWTSISDSMRKTLGLDMEAAVIGAIAHYQHTRTLDTIVMKGVMDFANPGRDDHFKEFAARASAECLIQFLRNGFHPRGFDDLLLPGTNRLTADHQPTIAQMLRACYELIPWTSIGHDKIIDELVGWAESPSPISLRLLHGPGGSGKTRLAIQWIKERRELGWAAGFLTKHSSISDWLNRVLNLGMPILIIVDYSESHHGLRSLITELSGLPSEVKNSRVIRVLLLARSAGRWWDAIQYMNSDIREWSGAAIALPEVSFSAETHTELFQAARDLVARCKLEIAPGIAPNARPGALRVAKILFILLDAVCAALGLSNNEDAIKIVLDREESEWAKTDSADFYATILRQDRARELVGAATALGGLRYPEDVDRIVEPAWGDAGHALVARLIDIYNVRTGSCDFLPSLEPDYLGEALVNRILSGSGAKASDFIRKILRFPLGPDAPATHAMIQFITRLKTTFPRTADHILRSIGDLKPDLYLLVMGVPSRAVGLVMNESPLESHSSILAGGTP